MADQPIPETSLTKLAEVLADAATAAASGVEYAEYLKNLRLAAKEVQDTLDQAEREYLDNLRLIRDDAQARLAAAEAVANVCSATKSRKTRKDKGTPKGPKNRDPLPGQMDLFPEKQDTQAEAKAEQDELPTDFPDGPPAEPSDEPF